MVILLCVLALTPSTPEEFLRELCINSRGTAGAEYWSEHASSEVTDLLSDPDTLLTLLENMEDLSVEPGPRTDFGKEGDVFRVEFGESRWTWRDSHGNTGHARGLTVVTVTEGKFKWVKLPALEHSAATIGIREKLISGVFLSFMLILSALLAVAWARRKYLVE